jgi:hypothetical protein
MSTIMKAQAFQRGKFYLVKILRLKSGETAQNKKLCPSKWRNTCSFFGDDANRLLVGNGFLGELRRVCMHALLAAVGIMLASTSFLLCVFVNPF